MIERHGDVGELRRQARGVGLAAFVRLLEDPAVWRIWRDELAVSGFGVFLEVPRKPQGLEDIARLDPAPAGVLITKGWTRHRAHLPQVMRWELLPAWVSLGLSDARRQELLAADEALASAPENSPEREAAVARLAAAADAVWTAIEDGGAPTTEALAASWRRYAGPADADQGSLFAVATDWSDTSPYDSPAAWSRAIDELVGLGWDLFAHPEWTGTAPGAGPLGEALAAFRSASFTYSSDTVHAALYLARATQNPNLGSELGGEARETFDTFISRVQRHAERVAATVWSPQWRRVFPSTAEVWSADPFLLPRLGYADPRTIAPSAEPMEPLGDYESGSDNPFQPVPHLKYPGRRCYAVPGADGFVVLEAGVWSGPSYTLREPGGTVVATLVKQSSGWHTVMGDVLPSPGNSVTVLPPQPYDAANFRHAVMDALRVWSAEQNQAFPGPTAYPSAMHLSWAFADLEPLIAALRTAGRRIWPLSFEDEPKLARVIHALEQVDPHDRIHLDDSQVLRKADLLAQLAPDVRELRDQLEQENHRGSDLYGVVTVLAGHAHTLPDRLRTTVAAREADTVAPDAAPQPASQASAAVPVPERYQPRDFVWVGPDAGTTNSPYVAEVIGYTRNGCFKVKELAYETTTDVHIDRLTPATEADTAADRQRQVAEREDRAARRAQRGDEAQASRADRDAERQSEAAQGTGAPPVRAGGEWAPEYPVPGSVGELWEAAKAHGWTTAVATSNSGYSQRLLVDLEAETAVGRWAFTLHWHVKKGRFAADAQSSLATRADGKAGPRGGMLRPTVREVLSIMRSHPALPEQPSEASAVSVTDQEPVPESSAPAATEPTNVAMAGGSEEGALAGASDEPTQQEEPVPTAPDDAVEIADMPGYWWRRDPQPEADPYADYSGHKSDRITVGYGASVVGHGHGPNGWDGRKLWTVSVAGDYMTGGREAADSAKLIAERHRALEQAKLATGPRPPETVWIFHDPSPGSRTYVYGVDEGDSDVLAVLGANNFKKAPNYGAYVQTIKVSPEVRGRNTGDFVNGMLKYGRSIAVHLTQDGGPADVTLPELDLAQRKELSRLDSPRDWSPVEFRVGDQVLISGPQSWWHTVADVQASVIDVGQGAVPYDRVLARRRGPHVLTAADSVEETNLARPGTVSLRGAPLEELDAERARLDLPLADDRHAPLVEARRAEITDELERVAAKLARLEKRRTALQAIVADPKALKAHNGQLLVNEAGEPLGAVLNRDKLQDAPPSA